MSLRSLCSAARAMYPAAEVHFRSIPAKEGVWCCVIVVGNVILVESIEGSLDTVLNDASHRIKNMTLTMKSYLDADEVGSPGSGPKSAD